ncbi:MAG: hypothetical protein M1836_006053 [Candelina mexicana]|nr:MAG: hypothetical protein M1836_006053 [Candelina mexicana]
MQLFALLSLLILSCVILAFPNRQHDELDAFLHQKPLHTAVLLGDTPTPTPCTNKPAKGARWRNYDNKEAARRRLSEFEMRRRAERWMRDVDDDEDE